MPGDFIFSICAAIVMLILGFGLIVYDHENKDDTALGGGIICLILSMALWLGYGYGLGLKRGSERTAKGVYKIEYTFDKEGKPCDTIVNWW